MTRPSLSELEKLARGQHVSRETFLALLANPDPQVREQLARAAQLRCLFEPDPELARDQAPASMPVSFEELAAYREGTLDDPARRAVVENFLREHFPEAVATGSGEPETQIKNTATEATRVDTPRQKPPRKDNAR
jgi:hypothetical protein